MIKFILASSSPRRLALLKDIGVEPDKIVASEIDETPRPQELPRQLAKRLALEKLHAVAGNFPSPAQREREGPIAKQWEGEGAIILAADTVVAVGRRILPKAETADEVRTCLKLLSGRRHHVYTAVALRGADGKIRERLADSTVIFRQLSPADIEAYAQCGEGIGKAGGYAIQGRAAALIRFISGSYSNIVGLPLFDIAGMLEAYKK